jgi:hypothetical protein
MVEISGVWGQTIEGVKRIGDDTTKTAGAQLKLQADYATSKMTPALAKLDGMKARLQEAHKLARDDLHSTVDRGKLHIADVHLDSETRAYSRSLPSEKRPSVIGNAIKTFDIETLRAIASAPAMLSGLTEQERDFARDSLFKMLKPDAFAREKSLGDAIKFAEDFDRQIRQSVADLVDFDLASQITKRSVHE